MKEWLEEISISTTDPYYIKRAQAYRDAARYYNPNPNQGSCKPLRGRPGARTGGYHHVSHV